jgi:hypothetical protein
LKNVLISSTVALFGLTVCPKTAPLKAGTHRSQAINRMLMEFSDLKIFRVIMWFAS